MIISIGVGFFWFFFSNSCNVLGQLQKLWNNRYFKVESHQFILSFIKFFLCTLSSSSSRSPMLLLSQKQKQIFPRPRGTWWKCWTGLCREKKKGGSLPPFVSLRVRASRGRLPRHALSLFLSTIFWLAQRARALSSCSSSLYLRVNPQIRSSRFIQHSFFG